jgi:hypothetical protein
MATPVRSKSLLELAKTVTFIPVALGFVVGSLPVLLPILLFRSLTGAADASS